MFFVWFHSYIIDSFLTRKSNKIRPYFILTIVMIVSTKRYDHLVQESHYMVVCIILISVNEETDKVVSVERLHIVKMFTLVLFHHNPVMSHWTCCNVTDL